MESKVLEIIDVSFEVLHGIVSDEKRLQSLINATVSHEMRNPLNSIYGQNLK